MDPRAGPRLWSPVARQLLLVARAEGAAPGARGARARGAAQEPRSRAGVGTAEPQGAPGEEQGAAAALRGARRARSEEHTSELQSPCNLVCRLLLEKKKS